jgi:hypothetical protein
LSTFHPRGIQLQGENKIEHWSKISFVWISFFLSIPLLSTTELDQQKRPNSKNHQTFKSQQPYGMSKIKLLDKVMIRDQLDHLTKLLSILILLKEQNKMTGKRQVRRIYSSEINTAIGLPLV